MLDKNKLKKIFVNVILVYCLAVVAFYFLLGDQLRYKQSTSNIEMASADGVSSEIIKGVVVNQEIESKIDNLEEIAVVFTKFYRDARGKIVIRLLDGDNILASKVFTGQEIEEQHRMYFAFPKQIKGCKDRNLTLQVFSNCEENEGVALMSNSLFTSGKPMTINGEVSTSQICFSMKGNDIIPLAAYYWQIVTLIGLIIGFIEFITYKRYIKGKIGLIVSAINALYRYKFLISQLVARDFKSKYKRSILGVLWSFLNPLLTMMVQFIVFSTIFKVDTLNYPIYLLSGVVFFSFFSECTSMCLRSIVDNSTLISKVYIPKYIFPLTRCLSSGINLSLSLIPLLLACLVLGIHLRPQALLFLYFLLCLVIFSLGIGMFLAALMVFFRDVQFLWSVIIQIWQYATPIFYPAEIIPSNYKLILQINPLYHFLGNARTCLMNGISPEPFAYVACAMFALASLFIGSLTFKMCQDKFALYI